MLGYRITITQQEIGNQEASSAEVKIYEQITTRLNLRALIAVLGATEATKNPAKR